MMSTLVSEHVSTMNSLATQLATLPESHRSELIDLFGKLESAMSIDIVRFQDTEQEIASTRSRIKNARIDVVATKCERDLLVDAVEDTAGNF